MTEANLKHEAELFEKKLKEQIQLNNITIEEHWMIDHLCYRAESTEKYEVLKRAFLKFSQLLAETPVNGRPICTFKLNQPIVFLHQSVDVVELPAPKPGKATLSGFEHVEIVCDLPFSEIEKRFSHVAVDSGGLRKDFNPEFELVLESCAIKFHHMSLESVVRLESIFHDFELLKRLKPHSPLIAGTLPLGVETEISDLDIVVEADGKKLKETLERQIENLRATISESQIDSQPAQALKFDLKGLPVEIIAQNRPSHEQTAFRHFLIEERLLRIGGETFRQNIRALRAQGLKTEPAFAKALNLQGDAYQQLLVLQKKSERELQKLFKKLDSN